MFRKDKKMDKPAEMSAKLTSHEWDLVLSELLDSEFPEAQEIYTKIIQQQVNQLPVKRVVNGTGVFYLTPDEINED
jgi:hypothetical protein